MGQPACARCEDSAMGEYGRVVGESSGKVGGIGDGGRSDMGGDVMGALSDLVNQIVTMPPEIIVLLVAAVMVGGVAMTWRAS